MVSSHPPLLSLFTLLCLIGPLPAAEPLTEVLPALEQLQPRIRDRHRLPITHDDLPPGGHLQGIQALPSGTLWLSGSSEDTSYLLSVDPKKKTVHHHPLLTSRFRHAGGFQIHAHRFLAVGLEDNATRDRSKIWILDLQETASTPDQRPLRPLIEIERAGPEKRATAGAVALAAHGGHHLLAVGTWDSATIDFYQSNGKPLTHPECAFTLNETWSAANADRSLWIDSSYGSYQNLNFIVDGAGKIFLLGFCLEGQEHRLDVFSLYGDPSIPVSQRLQKRASKPFPCNTTSFKDGAGVYVDLEGQLSVFSCGHRELAIEVFR